MDAMRQEMIRAAFRQLIDAADKAAADSAQAHADAAAMVPDAGDEDDAKFVAEERSRTAAEAYARDRVLDALTGAELIALGNWIVRPAVALDELPQSATAVSGREAAR